MRVVQFSLVCNTFPLYYFASDSWADLDLFFVSFSLVSTLVLIILCQIRRHTFALCACSLQSSSCQVQDVQRLEDEWFRGWKRIQNKNNCVCLCLPLLDSSIWGMDFNLSQNLIAKRCSWQRAAQNLTCATNPGWLQPACCPQTACSWNIAKGTTDPRVEFCLPK